MPMLPNPLHPPLPLESRERRVALARLTALGVAVVTPGVVQAQSAFGLPQLTELLSQLKSGEATFTETRTVSILAQTLQSSGRLSFAPPDSFTRETLKPRQEKVSVTGNTVTLSAGSRSRTVPLDSVPEAAVIVEAIRGTLTGNRTLLERHFNTTVTGAAQRWSLSLSPIEPRLQELVKTVQLAGEGPYVREVVVAMADGDRSVMAIKHIGEPGTAASGVK